MSLGHVGLRRLCLWQCFMNKKSATKNIEQFRQEFEAGKIFADSICRGPHASTLQELDLESCYFTDQTIVSSLQKHCPGLKLKTRGTKYQEEGVVAFKTHK
mmetsp:Transcript_16846/g.34562  ORF Transcript_16846/g.34562 Transcript_16846/m.34562 type:complete len:101 (-) Transcript_16846:16-318(-)